MPRRIECFYPGDSFPAISVTGRSCALDCKHCGRRYLESMTPAETPEELISLAEALDERGAAGMLISGGSDLRGKVPVARYADAIRSIKSSTDLLVNVHVGLASKEELSALVASGVDAFSADVYGADETVREVLGLDRKAEDYLSVVRTLKGLGATVAPHVCVGIHAGALKGELGAIDGLARIQPDALILISLIPTRDTAYESVSPPSQGAMLEVIRAARSAMPDTKLLLGCMRSKKDRSGEHAQVRAGLDGIVLPSAATVSKLEAEGYEIVKRPLCCAFAGTHL